MKGIKLNHSMTFGGHTFGKGRDLYVVWQNRAHFSKAVSTTPFSHDQLEPVSQRFLDRLVENGEAEYIELPGCKEWRESHNYAPIKHVNVNTDVIVL